jgi:glucose-6-phosphate isomerase
MSAQDLAVTQAWARFDAEADKARGLHIVDLFAKEPDRLSRLSLDAAGLFIDLSKQSWTQGALDASLALAKASGIEPARARLFAGEVVNPSEGRAVLHTALRAPDGADFKAVGEPVSAQVEAGRARMKALADDVRSGRALGATGKRFTTLLHIGIGGSDLGPRLVWEALKPLSPVIDLRFTANVDGNEIAQALSGLDPETTLVVAVSKTFTTLETLANAEAARDWLRARLGEEGARKHFAAVSAAPDKAVAFGVDAERVFAFWDWVGGRFSIWSAVGLSCAIALGYEAFAGFLAGAAAMDDHFVSAPLEKNAPVLLALAHLFNRNGLDRRARAVVPYAQRLRLLPAFLQQLEMESNGKQVRTTGQHIDRATATAVFGDAGTNGQHAFFQLLHQGADIIPVDLIGMAKTDEGPEGMHAKLLANLIAQAEALMIGRSEADVRAELTAKSMSPGEIDVLAPQRTFPGDRPTALILAEALTPQAIGAIIALYEHKTFVEGVIWGINSFDQWGVELGKTLAVRILGELEGGTRGAHDPSTNALVDRLKG